MIDYKKSCEIAAEYGFRPVHVTGPLGRRGWTSDGRNIWWSDAFHDEADARRYFSTRR